MNIDYLRFSLTDKCNLNCIYCNPLEKDRFAGRKKILTNQEINKTIQLFVKKGISKLRLTGGEPLLKKDLPSLIKLCKKIKELKDIAITTNGVLLKDLVKPLKKAGLNRINISLDTLHKERFNAITGKDKFEDVWEGIENSIKYGLNPVKLNVILMKGINDDEISDFAELTKAYDLVIRFIELFPTNRRTINFMSHKMESHKAKEIIESYMGELKPVSSIKGNGPAKYFKLKNSKGAIGFISNLSEYFCNTCNKIRINCTGLIAPCLFSGYIYDIKPLLRKTKDDKETLAFINEIIRDKPKYKKDPKKNANIEMSSIGG